MMPKRKQCQESSLSHSILHAFNAVILDAALLYLCAGLAEAQPVPPTIRPPYPVVPTPADRASPLNLLACLNSVNPLNPHAFGDPQGFQRFLRNCLMGPPAKQPDFRVMVQSDPMWGNGLYAGTQGYFPGTANQISNCHGFVGEMGLDVPGNNMCGNGFLTFLPSLPPGTPHRMGDVAVVYGRAFGAPYAWHSAIYVGRGYYLQRNGDSNIEVSDQNFIDNWPGIQKVVYVRPDGLGNFRATLSLLRTRLNPSEGPTADARAKISSIRNAFPK